MAEYTGLPLNTPTKVREDTAVEIWATRTANGGTVETRNKPGSTGANLTTIQVAAFQALIDNRTFIAIGAPNNAQVVAQTKALSRQVNGIIRQLLGVLDGTD